MDVTTKMLSATLVLVLVICHGLGGPIPSKNKLFNKMISKDFVEKHSQGHKIHRRHVFSTHYNGGEIITSENRFGFHNFLPYPNSNPGPQPGHYTPVFGNNFHHLPGHNQEGWKNHQGSFSHHHHVINHDYPYNHHHVYHNHYPHNHHNCKHGSSSSESEWSSEENNFVTGFPFPGKFTPTTGKPDKVSPFTPTPITTTTTTTPVMDDDVTPTYDIDVRLGNAGK